MTLAAVPDPPGRTPPHDTATERALITALFTRPDLAATLTLNPDHCYTPAHATILHAITAVAATDTHPDPITVAHHLDQHNQLEQVGGRTALAELAAGTGLTYNIPAYCKTITGLAHRRQLLTIAAELTEQAHTAPDAHTTATTASAALDQLIADNTSRRRLNRVGELLDNHIDTIEARAEGQHGGIPTGWTDLDRLIGGLRPGQVCVICGRPGMAKSAVALCLAINAAHEGHRTLVASIEMSDEELMDRTVASEARVALQNIRNGAVPSRDWERIAGHVQALSELPLWILDDPDMTVPDVRADARRIDADLIVVDYLQILTAAGGRPDDNRQVEVSGMSAAIKRMARQLEVPVVVLSQLNRAVELRADKRPMLADLRESGAIEQDADVVIGLYRDEYYKPDSKDKGIIEMDVLKQRNGPTGVAKLAFASQWVKVQNLAVA